LKLNIKDLERVQEGTLLANFRAKVPEVHVLAKVIPKRTPLALVC